MARRDKTRERDRDEESTPFFTRIGRWLMLLAALGLLWLGGGIAYIERVESLPAPDETKTDAIVVLTGARRGSPPRSACSTRTRPTACWSPASPRPQPRPR